MSATKSSQQPIATDETERGFAVVRKEDRSSICALQCETGQIIPKKTGLRGQRFRRGASPRQHRSGLFIASQERICSSSSSSRAFNRAASVSHRSFPRTTRNTFCPGFRLKDCNPTSGGWPRPLTPIQNFHPDQAGSGSALPLLTETLPSQGGEENAASHHPSNLQRMMLGPSTGRFTLLVIAAVATCLPGTHGAKGKKARATPLTTVLPRTLHCPASKSIVLSDEFPGFCSFWGLPQNYVMALCFICN